MTYNCSFRESLTSQQSIQNNAVIRDLSRRDNNKDICVISETTQKDVELWSLCLHNEESSRSRRGMCVAGSTVFERLHDIRETLVPVVDGIHTSKVRRDGSDGEEGRALEQNNLLSVNLFGKSLEET